MKRNLCVIILFMYLVAVFSFPANAVGENFFYDRISFDCIVGEKGYRLNNELIPYGETVCAQAENFSCNIAGTEVSMALKMDSNIIRFNLKLIPSFFTKYSGNTILGVEEEIGQEYTIASFRIEKAADTDTLLKEKRFLEGKTVLYLAIENVKKSEVNYFQLELKAFEFDKLFEIVSGAFADSGYTQEDAEKIEVTYITLTGRKTKNSSAMTFSQCATLDDLIGAQKTTGGNKVGTRGMDPIESIIDGGDLGGNSAGTLLPAVPDSVFKNAEFGEWTYGWNGWTKKTGYAVYTMQFGWEEDRLHYVMSYSISTLMDIETQTFDICFQVIDNCWVLYRAEVDELMIYNTGARLAADPEVYISTDSERGVFTRRYHTITKANSTYQRVMKLMIGYVPYLGEAVELYETITAGDGLETGSVGVYADNIELQAAARKIIKEVKVYAEKLMKPGDKVYLCLRGSEVGQAVCGFSYSVYDPTVLW